MTNYKFTVNCETNHDTEVFNTNDFNSAVMKFDQYKSECEELDLSYDINIVDNRTGEIYEYVAHHARRITEEELKALDTVFPEESPQALGKSFADCVNENIPDELIDTVWGIIKGE